MALAQDIREKTLDESDGGFRALPKTVRLQFIAIAAYASLIPIAIWMRVPSAIAASLVIIGLFIAAYGVIKYGIKPRRAKKAARRNEYDTSKHRQYTMYYEDLQQ